jgi:hypothetical protein
MTALAWMVGASLLSWLALAAAGGEDINPEALFGMLGPLGSASATWVAAQRAYGAAPERLTAVLIKGFGVKLLFFIVYVVIMLRGLALRPVPFVATFVGYLIALYAIEALFLKRLTSETPR